MARIFSFLALAVTVTATFAPDVARADDKQIAQQIADVMKATGALKNYDILVTYSSGTAQLQGTVTSEQQMRTAIEITQASPHVKKVDNKLAVSKASGAPVAIKPAPPLDRPVRISPVAAENPRSVASRQQAAPQPRIVSASLQNRPANGPAVQAAPPNRVSPPPVAAAPLAPPVVSVPATAFSRPVPMGPSSLAPPAAPQMPPMADPRMAQMRMAQMQMADPRMAQMMPPQQRPQAAPQPQQSRSAMAALAAPFAAVAAPLAAMAPQGGPQGAMQGPGPQPAYVPGTGGGVAPVGYDQPQLPAYAWPTYAPYPNYAALTYPKQYSPTAWPYIGPFYPYPQVPLGWRKVTLEWDDGWWFLDFKDK